MTLVSIIAPTYNCKNTIKETYDSVLSQAFKDREWIIVDDCSKDGSFSFVKELAKVDKRIVTKGNHNVLETHVIHSNSKNSNKSKLVKSMYRAYHESQGFNWLKSLIYVFRYALYSKKKYRDVN